MYVGQFIDGVGVLVSVLKIITIIKIIEIVKMIKSIKSIFLFFIFRCEASLYVGMSVRPYVRSQF